jgi:hypothetical protein
MTPLGFFFLTPQPLGNSRLGFFSFVNFSSLGDIIIMVSVYDYTKNSSCLMEWRKQGAAPAEFLRELRTLPRWEGLLWRGASERSVSLIDKSPILSTSKSIEIACRFSTGSLIAFYGFKGYDISSKSFYDYEQEVLVIPQPHKVRLIEGLVPIWLAMPLTKWQDQKVVELVEKKITFSAESIISAEKVVRKYVEGMGFAKPKRIINFNIEGTSIWVTGELPPKRLAVTKANDKLYIPF